MPIKRYQDVANPMLGAFPQIGKLYKGSPKREHNGREIQGTDLDYFRIEFNPEFEQYREVWLDLYGEKPTEFQPVFFLEKTTDDVFSTWREEWAASKMLHRCDGETQNRWWNAEAGEYSDTPKACESPACKCKDTGRIRLYLPQFIDRIGVLGHIALETHSFYDIRSVLDCLRAIEAMYGKLNGVPFVVGRAARQVSVPNPKKKDRMKVTKNLLYIRPASIFTQNVLIPALSGDRPIPAALPSGGYSDVITNPPNLQLGSGRAEGKARRIGGDEPARYTDPEAENTPETVEGETVEEVTPEAAHWTQTDRWDLFVGWAAKSFEFDLENVLYSLNEASLSVDPNAVITSREDWKHDEAYAVGAVIAARFEYDQDEIDQYFTENRYSDIVKKATREIADLMLESA